MINLYVRVHNSHQGFTPDGALEKASEFFIVSTIQQDQDWPVIVQNNTMMCNCANVLGPCEHKSCVAAWIMAQNEDPQRDAWLEREVSTHRPTEQQVYEYRLMLRHAR